MTSAYGVSDSTITRSRVEADLTVFRDYLQRYTGMKAACLEDLRLGVEHYATMPRPPELLELQSVPSFWKGLLLGVGLSLLWIPGSVLAGGLAVAILDIAVEIARGAEESRLFDRRAANVLGLIMAGGVVLLVSMGPFAHFKARIANGARPRENARRKRAYNEAVAAALKAAEPRKAAEDHRLRTQVQELEGLIKTLGDREADLRRLLSTL